ncbi:2-amino-4-hydroxy-6-hydroxymethyldihydropteridine diphosphokinase [Paenibacillus cellulosilyticus]|uniref:2-amino-4-hydroxy-6-hydroxymethyldihydropteridine diphosphokinase n=1 Tax=Paenibacillus cellulosilyticus TaxID=375489 RepID=A0A2V2YNL5_9BACL|nr:2-amino-4-hydroxy-6-hydroxymethyldihydropteridine diphosphokinase [Paenibacillus cellulosilyticus]PWV96022.1 2-amino-4-hydroxy-6-hydroxymethyldihydropteridine diphosphokinase [Paenibacillus cellulosilyticus]QKS48914.1 2-amino-4-hydroxy-6-hydroxymethyldihydropteridine diphosphokinase [Paenibacillus cellulosilyticus]
MVQSFPSDQAGLYEAYVALGSNLGDREQTLRQAIEQLSAAEGIQVERVSDIYETDPVGYTDQPAFLNMAVAIRTSLTPDDLLSVLFDVEHHLGRVRDIRFGPRTVDLDLLLYEGVTMDTERLILPHPRMMERAFVLVPLCDVLTMAHPLRAAVEQSATLACQDGKEGIKRWITIC